MVFLLISIFTLTSWAWINYIVVILSIIDVIYAIATSIKFEKNNK